MKPRPTSKQLVEALCLEPHPEGGYYRETQRASETIPARALSDRAGGDRAHYTCIFFLVTADSFSALHRIDCDEIFHFYAGDPVRMLQLSRGVGREISIGNDVLAGESPQVLVPRGTWQGLRLVDGGDYALLGCTVAPGFDFAGFELGDGGSLAKEYPGWAAQIERLSRPAGR